MDEAAECCLVCGVEIERRPDHFAVCDARRCRVAFLGAHPRAGLRAIDDALRSRLHELAALMLAAPTLAPGVAPSVAGTVPYATPIEALLPANRRALVPVDSADREAFAAAVAGRLAKYPISTREEETRTGGDGIDVDDAIERAMQQGCATCRGACCTRGGAHAFLTAAGLRATATALGLRLEDTPVQVWSTALHELYAGYLPGMHYAASCVFHAERGCALPRELRSDTCNTYLCGGLATLRRALQASPAPQVVIGAASWCGIERVAVVALA